MSENSNLKELTFESDKEVYKFELKQFNLLRRIRHCIETENIDSNLFKDLISSYIGAERVKLYWFNKYSKCENELLWSYVFVLMSLIPFVILFLLSIFYNTEIWVGDVCLSCWGK